MKRSFRIATAALGVASLALTACNKPTNEPKMVKASSNEIIQTPPPKDLPPPWEGTAGGGDRGGTVKCQICTKYCSVPQYDSNGRLTGSVRQACGTYSCNCGG